MADLHSARGETGHAVRQAREERFGGIELGFSRCGVFREGAVGQGGEHVTVQGHPLSVFVVLWAFECAHF